MLTFGEISTLARFWYDHFDPDRRIYPDLPRPDPDERVFQVFDQWAEGRIPTEVLAGFLRLLNHDTSPAVERFVRAANEDRERTNVMQVVQRRWRGLSRGGEPLDTNRWAETRQQFGRERAGRSLVWGVFFKPHRGAQVWDLRSLHQSISGAAGAIQARFDAAQAEATRTFEEDREQSIQRAAEWRARGGGWDEVSAEDVHLVTVLRRTFPGSLVIMPVILRD
jgi:hypothetical protein